MQLPFADRAFDVVACQFGVMFFPDKAKAFAEARRVLRAGGAFVFNAWDRIEHNEFADIVTQALAACFPQDPPRFMARTPHGYHDLGAIAQDLLRGGFDRSPLFTTLTERSRAASADIAAAAFCQGTPLRNEIESRDTSRLSEVTHAAAAAIGGRYGSGAIDAKMQAHVVEIEK
jgi:SAM-dependent methyltransferase